MPEAVKGIYFNLPPMQFKTAMSGNFARTSFTVKPSTNNYLTSQTGLFSSGLHLTSVSSIMSGSMRFNAAQASYSLFGKEMSRLNDLLGTKRVQQLDVCDCIGLTAQMYYSTFEQLGANGFRDTFVLMSSAHRKIVLDSVGSERLVSTIYEITGNLSIDDRKSYVLSLPDEIQEYLGVNPENFDGEISLPNDTRQIADISAETMLAHFHDFSDINLKDLIAITTEPWNEKLAICTDKILSGVEDVEVVLPSLNISFEQVRKTTQIVLTAKVIQIKKSGKKNVLAQLKRIERIFVGWFWPRVLYHYRIERFPTVYRTSKSSEKKSSKKNAHLLRKILIKIRAMFQLLYTKVIIFILKIIKYLINGSVVMLLLRCMLGKGGVEDVGIVVVVELLKQQDRPVDPKFLQDK